MTRLRQSGAPPRVPETDIGPPHLLARSETRA